jgi:hypothetical protein
MTNEELIARLRDPAVFGTQTAVEAADRIEALAAERDGFQQEAENYIDLLGKALAERDAAWNAAIRAAAKAAGDAAVTVLLRNEPNAPLIKRQVKRQSVAVPVLALLKP